MAPVTTKPTSTPSSGWEVILSSRDLRRPRHGFQAFSHELHAEQEQSQSAEQLQHVFDPHGVSSYIPLFFCFMHTNDENIMGMLRARVGPSQFSCFLYIRALFSGPCPHHGRP